MRHHKGFIFRRTGENMWRIKYPVICYSPYADGEEIGRIASNVGEIKKAIDEIIADAQTNIHTCKRCYAKHGCQG